MSTVSTKQKHYPASESLRHWLDRTNATAVPVSDEQRRFERSLQAQRQARAHIVQKGHLIHGNHAAAD